MKRPLGLGYDYVQETPGEPAELVSKAELEQALVRLPDTLQRQLRQGLDIGDITEVDLALAAVTSVDSALAAVLKRYAQDFRYAELLELLAETLGREADV